MHAEHPTDFGPYELLEQLGQGGMAIVYRARLRGASGFVRDVVLKAMLTNLVKSKQLVEMFEAEARLTAQLRHANIVQVENYGVADGIPYLIMEYLDGRNLSQLRTALGRARRRAPINISIAIARDLCHALGYAHHFVTTDGKKMQVIHRDVSPSNVMVQRDGTIKLLDFGVAKLWSAAGQAVTTSLKGKFAYMSPEQVNQEPIDRRCDVFAAGIVLHELLAGKRLFSSKNERETLRRVSMAEVSPPSDDNAEVPAELDRIVLRALALRPEDRYPSGVEMAAALTALGTAAGRRDLAQFVEELAPRGAPALAANNADTDPQFVDAAFEDVTAPEQEQPVVVSAPLVVLDDAIVADEPLDGMTHKMKAITPEPERVLSVERATLREVPIPARNEPASMKNEERSRQYTGPDGEFDARPTRVFDDAMGATAVAPRTIRSPVVPAVAPIAASPVAPVAAPKKSWPKLATPPWKRGPEPKVVLDDSSETPNLLPSRWLLPAAAVAIVLFSLGGTLVWRGHQRELLRRERAQLPARATETPATRIAGRETPPALPVHADVPKPVEIQPVSLVGLDKPEAKPDLKPKAKPGPDPKLDGSLEPRVEARIKAAPPIRHSTTSGTAKKPSVKEGRIVDPFQSDE